MQKILFILAFSTSIILQTNAQDIFKAPILHRSKGTPKNQFPPITIRT